jgi:hypothetical protein
MCTRTKTTYGCGCRHKSTRECHSQSCTGLARFHFVKEHDCDECRRGGDRVTRGREGKGRYARELKLSNAPSPATRPPLSPLSTNIKASPWAPEPPRPREKEWRSPVRRKADDAWLEEHELREQDLEAMSKMSSSGGSVSSPTTDYARDHRRRDENSAKLQDEVRRLKEELERLRVRRRTERSSSYDSFNTMDSSCSLPRGRSYDSGFHVLPSPYIPKVSSHHRLGRGLGDIIWDTTRPRGRW